jgi:molecular chaperone DnaJ
MVNFYTTLGLSNDASPEEIKKAYRKLVIEYHPDKTSGDKQKEEHFKQISHAYSVLSDPDKRSNYDTFGCENTADIEVENVDDLLSDLMGAILGGGGGLFSGNLGGGIEIINLAVGGGDLLSAFGSIQHQEKMIEDTTILHVSWEEIAVGARKSVEIEVLDYCPECNLALKQMSHDVVRCLVCNGQGVLFGCKVCQICSGQGYTFKSKRRCGACRDERLMKITKTIVVDIPIGVPDGHQLTFERLGSLDTFTNRYQDLIVKIQYPSSNDHKFIRGADTNGNLVTTIKIHLADVFCGFRKEVNLLTNFVITAPDGINPSKISKIPKKGLPYWIDSNPNNLGQGDLYIKWVVQYPSSKSKNKLRVIFEKLYQRSELQPDPNDILIE